MAIVATAISCTKKAPDTIVKEADRTITPCAGNITSLTIFSPELGKEMEVDIWTPDGYPEKGVKYPVLYMHDGQNVFDSTDTWMHNEWQVDEAATRLQKEGKIRVPIIVAVYNDESRGIDYMPANYYDYLPDSINMRGCDLEGYNVPVPLSNEYITFLCETLKPYIDYTYQTNPKRENTALMGSSMGALVSIYGIQYRPDIFGIAMGLSFPALENYWDLQSHALAHMPDPETHRIYVDTGDSDLDATFFPCFDKIEGIMQKQGFDHEHLCVRVFPGEGHNEGAWARRVEIPLEFAFGK